MSGAEVIGLVSGIIAIVDAILKIHDAVQGASGLPGSFRDVASRMPLLKDTVLAVQDDLIEHTDKGSGNALKQTLEACKEKAQALEEIFETVAVAPDASRPQRYASAVRTLGKGRKLEELMNGIQTDMQLLAANYAIKTSTRTRVNGMIRNMEVSRRLSEDDSQLSVANYGPGGQNLHAGNGDQNINTGSGSQFSGHFDGPFNFALSK